MVSLSEWTDWSWRTVCIPCKWAADWIVEGDCVDPPCCPMCGEPTVVATVRWRYTDENSDSGEWQIKETIVPKNKTLASAFICSHCGAPNTPQ